MRINRDNIKPLIKNIGLTVLGTIILALGTAVFITSTSSNVVFISLFCLSLTIARAMIQNCPMLILDEATSSVDTRTEVQIQQAMQNLMQGRTNFVIAHRLSTIRKADKILVMNEGKIVETGNHKELMAKDGFYAEIYNSQFLD